ncbi:MAG: hypothetical protein RR645_05995 [Clostridium sp.]
MLKIGKNFIGLAIVGVMTFGSVASISSYFNEARVVYAASKQLSDSRARVSHLYKSIHTNYLGIKNQGQWQEYIRVIRAVLSTLPLSEKVYKDKLTSDVNKAEKLVSSLSRINQVEKSIGSNTPRIGNTRQWDFYLVLGEQDLSKVDKTEFLKEVSELQGRLNKCYQTVERVIADYNVKYDAALKLYNTAEQSLSIDDGKRADEAARKLGSCEDSSQLVYECRLLLAQIDQVTLTSDEVVVADAYYTLQEMINGSGINASDTQLTTIENSIKEGIGSDVNVSVTKVFYNPDTGEEIFDVVISKGNAKLFPIGILFK